MREPSDYTRCEDAKGTNQEHSPCPEHLCELAGSRLCNGAREIDCRNQRSHLTNRHMHGCCNGDKGRRNQRAVYGIERAAKVERKRKSPGERFILFLAAHLFFFVKLAVYTGQPFEQLNRSFKFPVFGWINPRLDAPREPLCAALQEGIYCELSRLRSVHRALSLVVRISS